MSRLVILVSKVKRKRAEAKASLKRAPAPEGALEREESLGIDAKRDDLPLARMKSV